MREAVHDDKGRVASIAATADNLTPEQQANLKKAGAFAEKARSFPVAGRRLQDRVRSEAAVCLAMYRRDQRKKAELRKAGNKANRKVGNKAANKAGK